jgi:hypothetical protein
MRKIKKWEAMALAITPAITGLTIGYGLPEQTDAVLSKIFNVPSLIYEEKTPTISEENKQVNYKLGQPYHESTYTRP